MKHFWSTSSLQAIQQNVLCASSLFSLVPTPLTTPIFQTDLPILNSLSYLFSSLGDNHLSLHFLSNGSSFLIPLFFFHIHLAESINDYLLSLSKASKLENIPLLGNPLPGKSLLQLGGQYW